MILAIKIDNERGNQFPDKKFFQGIMKIFSSTSFLLF